MPIYTRRGDQGETSLTDGTRVPKDSARVEAYGTVHELNCVVGLARASTSDGLLDSALGFIQHKLFNCSSRLATPSSAITADTPAITTEDLAFLERAIDRFMATAGDFRGFVLEAGGETTTRLHVACAVARRAERRLVALGHTEDVDDNVMSFMNRVSDALFAAARYAAAVEGDDEQMWEPNAAAPPLD